MNRKPPFATTKSVWNRLTFDLTAQTELICAPLPRISRTIVIPGTAETFRRHRKSSVRLHWTPCIYAPIWQGTLLNLIASTNNSAWQEDPAVASSTYYRSDSKYRIRNRVESKIESRGVKAVLQYRKVELFEKREICYFSWNVEIALSHIIITHNDKYIFCKFVPFSHWLQSVSRYFFMWLYKFTNVESVLRIVFFRTSRAIDTFWK